MVEPTDDELLALFSSVGGDGSSAEGWLAIWKAGWHAGYRDGGDDATYEIEELAN